MGGESRSTTANHNQTVEAPFNNVDNRVIEGEASVVGGNTSLNAVGDLRTGDITQTDHGAVKAGESVSLAALATVKDSNGATLALVDSVVGNVVKSVEDLGFEREIQNTRILDGYGDTIADLSYERENERSALLSGFGDIVEALSFEREVQSANTLSEFKDELSSLSAERGSQSNSVLKTVSDLATVVQTNGESLQISANKYMGVAVVAGLTLVTFMAVKK